MAPERKLPYIRALQMTALICSVPKHDIVHTITTDLDLHFISRCHGKYQEDSHEASLPHEAPRRLP